MGTLPSRSKEHIHVKLNTHFEQQFTPISTIHKDINYCLLTLSSSLGITVPRNLCMLNTKAYFHYVYKGFLIRCLSFQLE